MNAARLQTSWGDEAPPFHRLIDQRDENMSDQLMTQLIEDLWVRAEIDNCALNEAIWALVEQWDTAVSDLKEITNVGSPVFQWQLSRLKEIDQTIDRLMVPTPLPKKERNRTFKRVKKRLEGGAV